MKSGKVEYIETKFGKQHQNMLAIYPQGVYNDRRYVRKNGSMTQKDEDWCRT